MTPLELITAVVLFVLAGGLTIWSNIILSKARKMAKAANLKCESAKEEIKELEKSRDRLSKAMDTMKIYATYGDRQPIKYRMVKTNSFYDVYATCESIDGRCATNVLIKRFEFDGDRDFARLEAQELLDHLNER